MGMVTLSVDFFRLHCIQSLMVELFVSVVSTIDKHQNIFRMFVPAMFDESGIIFEWK